MKKIDFTERDIDTIIYALGECLVKALIDQDPSNMSKRVAELYARISRIRLDEDT